MIFSKNKPVTATKFHYKTYSMRTHLMMRAKF